MAVDLNVSVTLESSRLEAGTPADSVGLSLNRSCGYGPVSVVPTAAGRDVPPVRTTPILRPPFRGEA